MIYAHVFPPGFHVVLPGTPTTSLALLTTCRQIHAEAVDLAHQNSHYHLTARHKKLAYNCRPQTLSALKPHLRNITVAMKLSHINPTGPNNPFLLMQLPLDTLTITFTDEPIVYAHKSTLRTIHKWHRKTGLYHKLLSALLYRSRPSVTDVVDAGETVVQYTGGSVPVHLSAGARVGRALKTKCRMFRPDNDQLRDVMLCCNATDVRIFSTGSGFCQWMIWDAFYHFRLKHIQVATMMVAGVERKFAYAIMQGDHGGDSFRIMTRIRDWKEALGQGFS